MRKSKLKGKIIYLYLIGMFGAGLEGCDLFSGENQASKPAENLHGEIRLALGYRLEDILKASAIKNYDLEERFDRLNGLIDLPGVDFFYDNPLYGFKVPNAMLVSIRSSRWSEDRKRYKTNEMRVRHVSVVKRPLYSSFDKAVEEVEEWNNHFAVSGFTSFEHKDDFSVGEVRARFSEEIPRNAFPTFYIQSLMYENIVIRLGVMRVENQSQPNGYLYNLNIVLELV